VTVDENEVKNEELRLVEEEKMRKAFIPASLLMLVTAILFATGLGSAVGAQISSVFVTNDSANPVPVQEQRTDANGNIKVHEQGTANVNVNGIVSVAPTQPANAFSKSIFQLGDRVSGPDPDGTRYAITAVAFVNQTDSPRQEQLLALHDTDCVGSYTGTAGYGPWAEVPAHSTVTMNFPQPFVLAPYLGDGPQCLLSDPSTVVGYRL
jgi:hypothetical protein